MITTAFALKFARENWKILALVGALLAVTFWHFSEVRQARREGYKSAVSDINKAAEKLEAKADEVASTVDACFKKGELWKWNRETHKCER